MRIGVRESRLQGEQEKAGFTLPAVGMGRGEWGKKNGRRECLYLQSSRSSIFSETSTVVTFPSHGEIILAL